MPLLRPVLRITLAALLWNLFIHTSYFYATTLSDFAFFLGAILMVLLWAIFNIILQSTNLVASLASFIVFNAVWVLMLILWSGLLFWVGREAKVRRRGGGGGGGRVGVSGRARGYPWVVLRDDDWDEDVVMRDLKIGKGYGGEIRGVGERRRTPYTRQMYDEGWGKAPVTSDYW